MGRIRINRGKVWRIRKLRASSPQSTAKWDNRYYSPGLSSMWNALLSTVHRVHMQFITMCLLQPMIYAVQISSLNLYIQICILKGISQESVGTSAGGIMSERSLPLQQHLSLLNPMELVSGGTNKCNERSKMKILHTSESLLEWKWMQIFVL